MALRTASCRLREGAKCRKVFLHGVWVACPRCSAPIASGLPRAAQQMENQVFESETWICARAATAGYKLTHKILKRLSDAGLIEQSKQVHRSGKAGSETCYPPGTGHRVLTILDICKGRRRPIDFIAWNLWWRGISVPEKYIAEELRKAAEWYDPAIAAIRKFFYPMRNCEMSDAGFTFIERIANAQTRLREQLFRQIRKRVMGDGRQTAIALVIELISGRFEPFIDSQLDDDAARNRDILDRALGLHNARRDRLAGVPPWLTADVSQTLADVSHALKAVRFVEVETSLELDDRNRIRDELRDLIETVSNAAIPLEAVFGKYAFGFGLAARLLKSRTPRIQAIGLLAWSVLRRLPGMQEGAAQLIRELPSSRAMLASYERLRELRATDRRFASILTDLKLAAALRDPAKMNMLQYELRAAAKQELSASG